jgi:hypothetical protein
MQCLTSASLRLPSRRCSSVCQNPAMSLPEAVLAWFGFLSRHRDEMRDDARRRFSSVVSSGFPGLMLAKVESWVGVKTIGVAVFGVALLASCHVVSLRSWTLSRRRGAWNRFYSVFSFSFPRLKYASYGVLNSRRDDRRHLSASCLVPSLSSCAQNMESSVGVSTLGVGLWVSCHMAPPLLLAWFRI